MVNQKDRKLFQFIDKEKDSSKSVCNWIAQYDEEDDFLCEKNSHSSVEFMEKEWLSPNNHP